MSVLTGQSVASTPNTSMPARAGWVPTGMQTPDPVEVGVRAIALHQLLVAAHLGQSRPVEDNDEIGHAHGAETVGNQDVMPTSAARQLLGMRRGCVAFEQLVFGLRVQRRCRLVEHHQKRQRTHVATDSASFCHWPKLSS